MEDLNEDYEQRPDDEAFCWLHALDASQAERLGIASSESTADSDEGDTPPPYPAWVSPEADAEACWITAEQLQESYARGRRLRQGGNAIRFELGCGLDWDPRHDSEQFPEEEVEQKSLVFPDGHRPLLQLSLAPDSEHGSKQLEEILRALSTLASIAKRR